MQLEVFGTKVELVPKSGLIKSSPQTHTHKKTEAHFHLCSFVCRPTSPTNNIELVCVQNRLCSAQRESGLESTVGSIGCCPWAEALRTAADVTSKAVLTMWGSLSQQYSLLNFTAPSGHSHQWIITEFGLSK